MVLSPWYDNLVYKKLEFTSLKNNIPFKRYKEINSEEVFQYVKSCTPDLCVIAHFEKLIKIPILEIPKLGFINLHPSLLPFYRGMAPQHWPIINGEQETGISVHYVDAGIDTGDIIVQERIPISEDMYVSDLQNQWLQIYSHIVLDAINRIINNYPPVKQPANGSYYGKIKAEQFILEPTVTCCPSRIRGSVHPPFCRLCIQWQSREYP